MKFKFIGNGKDDPIINRSYGLVFRKGVPLEVEDPEVCKKLSTNSHWEKVDGDPERSKKKGAPKA